MTNVIDSDTHLLTVLCLKVSTWVIFMSDYVKIPKTQAMKYFLYSFIICLLFQRLQLLSYIETDTMHFVYLNFGLNFFLSSDVMGSDEGNLTSTILRSKL